MKNIVSFFAICLVVMPAFAEDMARGRAARANNRVGIVTQFALPTVKQVAASGEAAVPINPEKTGVKIVEPEKVVPAPAKDMREKERVACLNNNIGVGNTFVWASKYSNTSNYSMMVEDVDEPENNVCFAKVDVKSDDSRISVSDIPSKYFQWGQAITCASWVNESDLEQRILDAKKTGRVWGTVAGTVGGAGLGVGAMELFGNKLIGGKVEGQKGVKDTDDKVELFALQLRELKEKDSSKYNAIYKKMQALKATCGDSKTEPCVSEFVLALDKLKD